MTDLIELALRAGRAAAGTVTGTASSPDFVARQWPQMADRLAHARDIRGLLAAAVELAAGADRLATVFVAGYQGALRALLMRNDVTAGPADDRIILCLAATEAGGARPTAIETALTPTDNGYKLQGAKQWITGAGPGTAAHFLVVARLGDRQLAGGKLVPNLVVVRVAAQQPGVSVTPMPPTPFIPEVPHGQPRFDGVAVGQSDILPGDGYENYLKPFRTTEDIFVMAAVAAYLLVQAQRAHRLDIGQRCAHALQSLAGIAERPWLDATVHLVLAGVVETMGLVAAAAGDLWPQGSPQAARWQHDQALLMVAGKARAARAQSAWERLR